MSDNLEFPTIEAAESVLTKVGINPSTRIHPNDQDFEYTSCRMEELDKYLELYDTPGVSDPERRILGCYFMEGLNDFVFNNDKKHPLHDQIIEIFKRDYKIHHFEIQYRLETEDDDPENWWPIRKHLLEWWKA